MQLILTIAVVGAFAIAESLPAEPVDGGVFRAALALAGIALVVGVAVLIARVGSLRLRASHTVSTELQVLDRWKKLHVLLWLGVAGAILYVLAWPQLVRENMGLGRIVLVDDLMILAPIVVPLVLSWAAFFELPRALRLRADSPAQYGLSQAGGRREYVLFHCRHELSLVLAPTLALLTAYDFAELASPGAMRGSAAWLLVAPLLAALFVLLPWGLRWLWRAQPLPEGPLRNRLLAAGSVNSRVIGQVLLWRTGDRVVNAAVAGVVRPLRYVFLSDGLLARLNDEQVEAVFAHELGHVRHRHQLFRLAALLLPAVLYFYAEGLLQKGAAPTAIQAGLLGHSSLAALLLGPAWLVGYMALVFGRYSRLLEQQADLCACGATGEVLCERRTAAFVAALEKLEAACPGGGRLAHWLHPSVADRTAFLRAALRDASLAIGVHRHARRSGQVLLFTLVAATILLVLQ
jgi:STE24 endopeptidase